MKKVELEEQNKKLKAKLNFLQSSYDELQKKYDKLIDSVPSAAVLDQDGKDLLIAEYQRKIDSLSDNVNMLLKTIEDGRRVLSEFNLKTEKPSLRMALRTKSFIGTRQSFDCEVVSVTRKQNNQTGDYLLVKLKDNSVLEYDDIYLFGDDCTNCWGKLVVGMHIRMECTFVSSRYESNHVKKVSIELIGEEGDALKIVE